MNGDVRDMGWMCREHAFLTASLAALSGYPSAIMEGRLALKGETTTGAIGLLRIDTHAWCGVEGIGIFDLSLNLSPSRELDWKPWPGKSLVASKFYPKPEVTFTYRLQEEKMIWELDQKPDKARDSVNFSASYLGETYVDLTEELVGKAVSFIHSPLTDDLKCLPNFDDEIYAKGARHLWNLCHHRCRSLSDLNQIEAWHSIASSARGANSWLAGTAKLAHDPHS
jgi:hypothetical protein